MKKLICLLIALFTVCASASVFAAEPSGSDAPASPDDRVWSSDCSDLSDVYSHSGVEVYKLSPSDAEIFYGDTETIQRNASSGGEVVYAIPYITSLHAVAYHWSGEEFEPFKFELSGDGETWTDAEVEYTEESEEGKWTRAVYDAAEIGEGYGFLKVVWPKNPTYWTPVLGEISAEFDEPSPRSIVIKNDSRMTIPRFDTAEYALDGAVYDQLGIELSTEISWRVEFDEELSEVSYDEEKNAVIIGGGAPAGAKLSIYASVEGTELEASLEVTLENFVYGDFNNDLKIDETDLNGAIENFRKSVGCDGWDKIRYLDINDDEVINIIDIAYIAKQIKPQEEK